MLAFGTRHRPEYGWLPRSKAMRFGYVWTEGRVDDPWDVEAEVGELEFAEPGERPPNVVALEDVELDEDGDRLVAEAGGSVQSGLKWSQRRADARARDPALPLGRGGGVRRARGRRHARAVAVAARGASTAPSARRNRCGRAT